MVRISDRQPNDTLFISLAGPFHLWRKNNSHSINSKQSKRLLAILLLSPNMRKSRSALQILLWDETKCNPQLNLRQLLSQTKNRLGEFSDRLIADNETVSLIEVINKTERFEGNQMDFFEDAGIGTDDFEEWYRIETANFENLVPVVHSPELQPMMYPHPVVGLTNTGLNSMEHRAGIVADWVSNHLRDVFVWNSFVEFADLRDVRSPKSVDLEVQVSVNEIGEELEIAVAGFIDGSCRWSQSANYPSGKELGNHRQSILEFAHKASAFIEKIACQYTAKREGSSGHIQLFDTIVQLFTMKTIAVEEATQKLLVFSGTEETSQLLAWQAFGRMLQNGERLIENRTAALAEAERLIAKALDLDPFDLSALSVGAHYHAYVHRDFAQARTLSNAALDLAPFSPFALDVRATLELYEGCIEEAVRHANLAYRMGRYGPMRYYIAGTGVMLASIQGEHEKAIELGTTLLRSRPTFLPVLRHLVPSLLEVGAVDDAMTMLSDIRLLDPEYATPAMLAPNYPLPSEHSRVLIRTVLEKHGLI